MLWVLRQRQYELIIFSLEISCHSIAYLGRMMYVDIEQHERYNAKPHCTGSAGRGCWQRGLLGVAV